MPVPLRKDFHTNHHLLPNFISACEMWVTIDSIDSLSFTYSRWPYFCLNLSGCHLRSSSRIAFFADAASDSCVAEPQITATISYGSVWVVRGKSPALITSWQSSLKNLSQNFCYWYCDYVDIDKKAQFYSSQRLQLQCKPCAKPIDPTCFRLMEWASTVKRTEFLSFTVTIRRITTLDILLHATETSHYGVK